MVGAGNVLDLVELRVVAAALLLAIPTAASATHGSSGVVINLTSADIGRSFTIAYTGYVDGRQTSGLQATTQFTLLGISANNKQWTFGIDAIANHFARTDHAGKITAFGFNTDHALASGTTIGGSIFRATVLGGRDPSTGHVASVCFGTLSGHSNGCSSDTGGGVSFNDAVYGGSLALKFRSAVTALSLDSFFLRYDELNARCRRATGIGLGTSGGFNSQTPEPAVWLQMIIGFGLAGAVMRRRVQSTQPSPASR